MTTTITGAGMSAHYNTIAATRSQRTDPVRTVTDTLGVTGDDLKTQLRSGRSQAEVASGRGVDDDKLVGAVRDGLPADRSTDATSLAALDNASKAGRLGNLLDVGSDELASQVSNATDLVQLMQKKGVDLGQLRSILNNGDLLDVSM
jgi:hypothetical protein